MFYVIVLHVGWVKPELPTTVMIQYNQRDLARNKKNRIVRSFFQGDSFSFKPAPFALNMTNVVMMEPSPSWTYLAVMRSLKEKGEEEEKYALEVRASTPISEEVGYIPPHLVLLSIRIECA